MDQTDHFADVFVHENVAYGYDVVTTLGRSQVHSRRPLSSTGSISSNTDLSDLSTVGTCDIFVYQMRDRVM